MIGFLSGKQRLEFILQSVVVTFQSLARSEVEEDEEIDASRVDYSRYRFVLISFQCRL